MVDSSTAQKGHASRSDPVYDGTATLVTYAITDSFITGQVEGEILTHFIIKGTLSPIYVSGSPGNRKR